jgi:hypothetical protein
MLRSGRAQPELRDAPSSVLRAFAVTLLRLGAAFGLIAWLAGGVAGASSSAHSSSARTSSPRSSSPHSTASKVEAPGAGAAATHQLTPTGSHVTRHAYDGGALNERCDGGSDDRSHGRDPAPALPPLPGSALASFRIAATSLPLFSANRSHRAGADVAIPSSRAPPGEHANV